MKYIFTICFLLPISAIAQKTEKEILLGKWKNLDRFDLVYDFYKDSLIVSKIDPFKTTQTYQWSIANDTLYYGSNKRHCKLSTDTLILENELLFTKIAYSTGLEEKIQGNWISESGAEILEFTKGKLEHKRLGNQQIELKWKINDNKVFINDGRKSFPVDLIELEENKLVLGEPLNMTFTQKTPLSTVETKELNDFLIGSSFILKIEDKEIPIDFKSEKATISNTESSWRIVDFGVSKYIELTGLMLKVNSINKNNCDVTCFHITESGYNPTFLKEAKLIKKQ
jgi:hypothetical protein